MRTEPSVMESAAAQALLDKGAGFNIPAPFLFQWFGKKTISITLKRLRLGTLLYISELIPIDELKEPKKLKEREKVINAMGSELTSLKLSYIRENGKEVCKAIACGLLNSKWKIKLFSNLLANYLKWKCTTDELQELALWLLAYGRAESFMNTTKLLRTMKMTTPKNLGQTTKRS